MKEEQIEHEERGSLEEPHENFPISSLLERRIQNFCLMSEKLSIIKSLDLGFSRRSGPKKGHIAHRLNNWEDKGLALRLFLLWALASKPPEREQEERPPETPPE